MCWCHRVSSMTDKITFLIKRKQVGKEKHTWTTYLYLDFQNLQKIYYKVEEALPLHQTMNVISASPCKIHQFSNTISNIDIQSELLLFFFYFYFFLIFLMLLWGGWIFQNSSFLALTIKLKYMIGPFRYLSNP